MVTLHLHFILLVVYHTSIMALKVILYLLLLILELNCCSLRLLYRCNEALGVYYILSLILIGYSDSNSLN